MSDVILLSKPGCVQCNAVARKLVANGVEFEKIDVSEDPEWLSWLDEKSIKRVPVTVRGDEYVEGFDPDGLERLF
jgi:glutaredoxin-like protein NrdH